MQQNVVSLARSTTNRGDRSSAYREAICGICHPRLCNITKSFYLAFANKDSHPNLVLSMFFAWSVLNKVMFKHASCFRIGNRIAKMPHVLNRWGQAPVEPSSTHWLQSITSFPLPAEVVHISPNNRILRKGKAAVRA